MASARDAPKPLSAWKATGGVDCAADSLRCAEVEPDLQIQRISLLRTENTKAHHTTQFQTHKLVVRRGQVFHLHLLLSRPLRPQDTLKLQCGTGPKPSIAKHTLIALDLSTSLSCHGWTAAILKKPGLEVVVAVTSSPNAIVGLYSLEVRTEKFVFQPEDNKFYLLFNPWCAEDAVFLPSEEERKEYVLNDTGYIYMGSSKQIKEKPWTYGQFEKNVLDCSVLVMNAGFLKTVEMRDPVLVSRNVGAMVGVGAGGAAGPGAAPEPSRLQAPQPRTTPMATRPPTVNSENKNGVLVGNWSGEYKGGTAPYQWAGSVPILQQYYATRASVAFGQCWVFAGILTTVLRALGIPARSVTVFDSAHDTEKNLTLDVYVNEMGKTLSSMSSDSIWNFHVWTEAWMRRQDLPRGNDGWQVVDGTPQELSHGVFCCGPSPLAAIRKGNIFMGYDTKFVFSEVNADKLIWLVRQVNGHEKVTLLSVETMAIGKSISTKVVGQDRRHDITYNYKFPEGSKEERAVMDNAFSLLSFTREYTLPAKEILLELSVDAAPVMLGGPLVFSVTLRRKTGPLQSVTFSGSFDLQSYTGKQLASLGVVQKTVQMEDTVSKVVLTWDAKTYLSHLGNFDDDPVVKGFILAEVGETKETMAAEVCLSFVHPELTVELPSTGKVGQVLTCMCIFKNSLAIPLTDVRFSVDSLGIASLQVVDQGGVPAPSRRVSFAVSDHSVAPTVPPGETVQSGIKCTPVRAGPRKFIIRLSSRQVKDIYAEKVVLISS
ncbi:protein-glutamine gamma-glutamyltransferase 4 [Ctenodactylus gundi]